MNKSETDSAGNEEQEIARLLRAAGPRQELPSALKNRWEQTFREELKSRRKRRSNMRLGSLAASIMALGVATVFYLMPETAKPQLASVTSVSGDTRLLVAGEEQVLRAGQLIPYEATIITGTSGFTALRYGAYDLRVREETRLQLNTEAVNLELGQIYLSDEGNSPANQSLSVNTRFGTVQDVGTQFTVSVDEAGVTSMVRRGALKITTAFNEYRAEAGALRAKEISFNNGKEVLISDISGAGSDWDWIYQGSPVYALEGNTVDAFLQWSSAESGMAIEYLSENAALYAQTETLHGDIRGMDPDAAVERVLASTYLTVDRSEANVLKISLIER